MRRPWLLLIFALVFFTVQAFAQIGVVVQLPPNADVNNLAAHANGTVVAVLPEANQFLLSVPVPPLLLASDDEWIELNQGTRLPSGPHHVYISGPTTPVPDWYKTQPAFGLINLPSASTYSTGAGVI